MRNYPFTPTERRTAGRILRLMIFFIVVLSADAIAHGPAWLAAVSFLATQLIGMFGLFWASRVIVRRERENQ